VQSSGGNDAGGCCIDLGPPFSAEAAGDFSENHGRSKGTLTRVVRVGHVAPCDEAEKVSSIASHGPKQPARRWTLWHRPGQEPIQPFFEVTMVACQGCVLQFAASFADCHSPKQ
jgi:hypothetical protein